VFDPDINMFVDGIEFTHDLYVNILRELIAGINSNETLPTIEVRFFDQGFIIDYAYFADFLKSLVMPENQEVLAQVIPGYDPGRILGFFCEVFPDLSSSSSGTMSAESASSGESGSEVGDDIESPFPWTYVIILGVVVGLVIGGVFYYHYFYKVKEETVVKPIDTTNSSPKSVETNTPVESTTVETPQELPVESVTIYANYASNTGFIIVLVMFLIGLWWLRKKYKV